MAEPVLGEDLLRNIPLGHFDADAEEPTPAAFWPRPEDQGRLSTDREAIWTAEQSFQFRTAALNLPSSSPPTTRSPTHRQHGPNGSRR